MQTNRDLLSRVWLFATPQSVAHHAPLSMGILQARIWVGFHAPIQGPSQPRDGIQVSHITGRFFTVWVNGEAQEYWSGYPYPSPGIFPTQGSNPVLPHCRQTLPSEPLGKPIYVQGMLFQSVQLHFSQCLPQPTTLFHHPLFTKKNKMLIIGKQGLYPFQSPSYAQSLGLWVYWTYERIIKSVKAAWVLLNIRKPRSQVSAPCGAELDFGANSFSSFVALIKKEEGVPFLVLQWLRTCLLMWWMWVWSLVRELRSHMLSLHATTI